MCYSIYYRVNWKLALHFYIRWVAHYLHYLLWLSLVEGASLSYDGCVSTFHVCVLLSSYQPSPLFLSLFSLKLCSIFFKFNLTLLYISFSLYMLLILGIHTILQILPHSESRCPLLIMNHCREIVYDDLFNIF